MAFVYRFEPGNSPLTLLTLHGTGGDENDLIPLARQLAPEAKVLSPRGKVLENGAPRFFRRLAMGVFDEADLKIRASELSDFVAQSVDKYKLNAQKIYALGYSNGANMAATLLLLHPGLLAGGILLRPVMPLEPESKPSLSGKGVFMAAGTLDPWAPKERVERLAQVLQAGGAEVQLRWQQGGHELHPAELEAAQVWVKSIQSGH